MSSMAARGPIMDPGGPKIASRKPQHAVLQGPKSMKSRSLFNVFLGSERERMPSIFCAPCCPKNMQNHPLDVYKQGAKRPRTPPSLWPSADSCAHVAKDVWVCTRGLYKHGVFDEQDPFGEASLELRNIRDDAELPKSGPPRKRVKAHLRKGSVYDWAKQRPAAWDAAVAMAVWRAEAERAALEGRLMDERAATSGFERNPFAWADAPCPRQDIAAR